MNVGELKARLMQYPDETPVRIYTDHGQYAMSLEHVYNHGIEEDIYMAELNSESEISVVLLEG